MRKCQDFVDSFPFCDKVSHWIREVRLLFDSLLLRLKHHLHKWMMLVILVITHHISKIVDFIQCDRNNGFDKIVVQFRCTDPFVQHSACHTQFQHYVLASELRINCSFLDFSDWFSWSRFR